MNLDSLSEIKLLDSQNMLGSIEKVPNQVLQIIEEIKNITIPMSYKKINHIAFLGMGGSTLGAHCIRAAFESSLSVPFEIVNDYHIPAFIGKQSLVFVVSYSGTTAEPLAALTEAKKKGAKIIIISSGGDLAKVAKRLKIPALIFKTTNNPCGSPRMGLGYTIFGPLLILAKLKLIAISTGEIQTVFQTLTRYGQEFGVAKNHEVNQAKLAAESLLGKSVWYIGANHLAGSVHVAANQMNENAKRFAGWFAIPELNHHLLEGLVFPKENSATLSFVLVESTLYDKRVQKRFAITKEILQKNNIAVFPYPAQEKTKLLQVAELLVFSSYVSFYSALLEGIDPTAIPVVDYFKSVLNKA
jgi:glucose/mannose-6-phosphate isomerase